MNLSLIALGLAWLGFFLLDTLSLGFFLLGMVTYYYVVILTYLYQSFTLVTSLLGNLNGGFLRGVDVGLGVDLGLGQGILSGELFGLGVSV